MTLTSRRKGEAPLYRVIGENGKTHTRGQGGRAACGVRRHPRDRPHFQAGNHGNRGICAQLGAKRLVITHPELAAPKLDLPTMVELAKAGAYMEFCAVNLLPVFYSISVQGLLEAIEAVTPERTIISSDGGQPFNPRPHEAIRIVIQSLHEKGLTTDTIQTICIENQRRLLGL